MKSLILSVVDGCLLLNTVHAASTNYPNPFRRTTTISYTIPEKDHVTLEIFSVGGRRVRTLVNEAQSPRPDGYEVQWDGRNTGGNSVRSGVYFYRLTAGERPLARKMVLLD